MWLNMPTLRPSEKMKFLFLSSDYKPMPGGVAEYLDTLARGLINLGHKVKVLAVAEKDEREKLEFLCNYEKWVIPFPITYDQRPGHRRGNYVVSMLEILRCLWPSSRRLLDKTSFFQASVTAVAQLAQILRREAPDVIVLGYLDPRLYPLFLHLQENNQAYGIIAHDFEVRKVLKINDIVIRGGIIKGARWIVANSHHTARVLKSWRIAPSRIAIIHPPVSAKLLESANNNSVRDPKRPLEVVTVARLVSCKAIDIVLRALRILDSREIAYRYTIAGTGPERDYLEKIVVELGIGSKVEFVGYISDGEKRSLLRRSDVFVMVSRVRENEQHEGFGIGFMEAAACGIPSVGSRAGGIPEAVVEGETGVLVCPESEEELADALAFFASNPQIRQRMGMAAAERAARFFSPTVIATQFQNEVGNWLWGKSAEINKMVTGPQAHLASKSLTKT